MSPADDQPEFSPVGETVTDEQWLDELHRTPAYLKMLEEIDLEDKSPGIPAEDVRRWVESWGTAHELPMPVPKAG